ncbi:asparaginase [Paenibacillus humicola]|uniref:asparaginase n=1 Tax=Paenibacillus humicola TaxID=3110540 RepID=UPI00237A8A89|nr:asparaginase [Paenibacillus humicola]
MSRVALIATGGTISMDLDPVTGKAVPSLDGKQLLATIPKRLLPCEVDVIDYGRIGGAQLTPNHFREIAKRIESLEAVGSYDGYVVVQGTDVMEETAYLLDLLLDLQAPVAVTGAMRHAGEAGPDGAANLLQAIVVAGSRAARGKGVLVVLANEIYAAMDAVKTHSFHVKAFDAPGKGPIGAILNDRVVFFYQPLLRRHCKPDHLDARVFIVKCGIGENLDDLPLAKYDGFVIEGTGVGNGQVWMEEWIARQHAAGKPVVITSRCQGGWVDSVYGYPGSVSKLAAAGAILGHGLNAVKARIQLIAILGETRDLKRIEQFFEWM